MAARLILNADDFGLTRGINRAIAELHAAGALTSATLMATGPAFEDAVAIAHAHPKLGVGCHIVLTDGTPAAPLDQIPSLLGPDGKNFRPTLSSFLLALYCGAIREEEILIESLHQIETLQSAGVAVTHLDTHKHTHIWPPVARSILAAARKANVGAVRNPFEPNWSLALGDGKLLRALQVRLTRSLQPRFLSLPEMSGALTGASHLRTTDGTLAISATGNLNETSLRHLLTDMPEGTWELCCHPGYNDADLDAVTTRLREHREIERLALLAAFPPDSPHPFSGHLIHYGDLVL